MVGEPEGIHEALLALLRFLVLSAQFEGMVAAPCLALEDDQID
jgi:hypothetical protein